MSGQAMDRETERSLAAGAMLEDLEPHEALAWQAHRADCTECRLLVGDLAVVLADLALVAPERVPPPDLLASVRRAIAAESAAAEGPLASITAFPSSADREARAESRAEARAGSRAEARAGARADLRGDARTATGSAGRGPRPLRGVLQASIGIAAALAVATGVLGWRAVTLQSDLDATTARIANLETVLASSDGMMSVATNPAHLTVVLHAEPLAPTATAVLMFVPGSTQAYLAADHLPATPAGQAYQLWYADAAGVHPLGVSRFDGAGAFIAPLGVDLGNAAAVMITLEAAGGATGDPGPQVIFGEL